MDTAKLTAAVETLQLWPIYEFRPLPDFAHQSGPVLRYADGAWIPDDGEYDVAFIGRWYALYVDLPYQRNILWSWLTCDWRANVPAHPRGNPWHYMLRDGATEWGGCWGRDRHPNRRASDAAMSKCCSLYGAANGRGPKFELNDPYIAAGLVRERVSKRVVTFPERPVCMYCGEQWRVTPDTIAAATGEG